MYAGVAATLVNLGQAGGIIVSLWAQAGEAIDAIHTCASIVTGIDGTVVNVDVTHCSCKTVNLVLRTVSQTFLLDELKWSITKLAIIEAKQLDTPMWYNLRPYSLLTEIICAGFFLHMKNKKTNSLNIQQIQCVPSLVAPGGSFTSPTLIE